ncbi:MAG TPA: hypothetical protein VN495_02795 [Candidatus Paceibacterota bacterium]|nr:hypothetical protein [Candidatus Paceibacterota bacterium]
MLVFSGILFIVSLSLIAMLFGFNIREARTGRYIATELRTAADHDALYLKELMEAADVDLKKIPPLLSHFAHVCLHIAALEFARFARNASRQAHRLADFVSHKRNFERRETRSEFLNKLGEYKNGNVAFSEDENGQTTEEQVES